MGRAPAAEARVVSRQALANRIAFLFAGAATFDLVEEVLVGIACASGAFFSEDLVELAAVEPDAAAFGAGVNQDFAAFDLDESCAVVWAAGLAYAASSVVLGVAAVWVGAMLGRTL